MFCKNCGTELNENQAVCLSCGFSTNSGDNFCQNCGKEVTPGAAFCINCGNALKKTETTYKGYDKVAIALLAIFLGGIGIHNFILGENKKGIMKIVLTLACGIGSIFAIIDFVKILIDKYTIDENAYF